VSESRDARRANPELRQALRKSRRRGVLIALGLMFGGCVVVAGLMALYVYHAIHSPQNRSTAYFAFPVVAGDTPASVERRLQARGVLHNPLLFGLDARVRGLGSKLRVGTYRLQKSMSIDAIIAVLGSDKQQLITITIPAGWRAEQIAADLDAHHIDGQAFLHAVRYRKVSLGFNAGMPSSATVEGFLFPDTYSVAPGYGGKAFAALMIRRFAQVFNPALRAEVAVQHRTVFQVVNLASIVEKETGGGAGRRKVAGVYLNRLQNPAYETAGYLDSDPTVSYALGSPSNWWPAINVSDYHSVQSPYNTYLHKGLPKGPICEPSKASLLAALTPARTTAYYFLAAPSGRVVYFHTLAQQQAYLKAHNG
jgi:UPF0755 protein